MARSRFRDKLRRFVHRDHEGVFVKDSEGDGRVGPDGKEFSGKSRDGEDVAFRDRSRRRQGAAVAHDGVLAEEFLEPGPGEGGFGRPQKTIRALP